MLSGCSVSIYIVLFTKIWNQCPKKSTKWDFLHLYCQVSNWFLDGWPDTTNVAWSSLILNGLKAGKMLTNPRVIFNFWNMCFAKKKRERQNSNIFKWGFGHLFKNERCMWQVNMISDWSFYSVSCVVAIQDAHSLIGCYFEPCIVYQACWKHTFSVQNVLPPNVLWTKLSCYVLPILCTAWHSM